MNHSLIMTLKSGWMLIRFIAVISSSIAAVASSLLPLFIYTSISSSYLLSIFIFVSIGAILIHGILVHLFNDYIDYLTGTDAQSPAILSGGSRVIQEGLMQPELVWKTGKRLAIALLMIALYLAFAARYELMILIIIGVWAAVSYSVPPLRLSYRPFLGEWFSLFPAVFFIGIAGPWIILDTIPLWTFQHAIINALVCMAWVMVHHIPDIEADQQAIPKKRTTVVWFAERLGMNYARMPALIYFTIALTGALWVGMERIIVGLIVTVLLVIALFLVLKMDISDDEQVSQYEQILLLIAVVIAVVLGII